MGSQTGITSVIVGPDEMARRVEAFCCLSSCFTITWGSRNDFDDVIAAPYVTDQVGERSGSEAAASLDVAGGRYFSAPA